MDNYSANSTGELRKLLVERGLGPKSGAGLWRAKSKAAEAMAWLRVYDLKKREHESHADAKAFTNECIADGQDPWKVAASLRSIQRSIQPTEPAPAEPLPPASKPAAEPAPAEPAPASDEAEQKLRELLGILGSQSGGGISEERVVALIKEHSPTPPTIEVLVGDAEPLPVARQHFKFPLLMACQQAGVPAMMVGPAGSGKTTVASAVAEAAGLDWDAISAGPMTTKGDLFGFKDANGNYHQSSLVKQATEGGVFLCDEMDAANPGVLTGVNMVLANGHLATPEGLQEKHDDFWFVAGANTFGTGANRQYIGRNQLDAATLDRFAIIDWPYDEGIEAAACGLNRNSPSFSLSKGGKITADDWFDLVQAYRKAAEKLKLKVVISPRASIYGCKLAACGVGKAHLLDLLIFKGMDAETCKRLKSEAE